MHALLSIKPVFARQIMAQTKTVEFRKAGFKRDVDKVYVYSSSPEQRIIGYFKIGNVVVDHPASLWDRFGKVGGIQQDAFFEYYKGKTEGVTFCIEEVFTFETPVDPRDVFPNFVPPQSFMYLDSEIA